jgi:hypothetical protein
VGFVLWLDRELAWAAGTHEYRPMGVAVVSKTDLFRPADFRATRRRPPAAVAAFSGYFASLGDLNAHLTATRRRNRPVRRAGAAPPGCVS